MIPVYKIRLIAEIEAWWLVLYTRTLFCNWLFSFYSTVMVESALANLSAAHEIDWVFKNVSLNSQKRLATNYEYPYFSCTCKTS